MREAYIRQIIKFLDMLDEDYVRKVYSFTKTLAQTKKREVTD